MNKNFKSHTLGSSTVPKKKRRNSKKGVGYAVADIDTNEEEQKYTVRYIQSTPKVYKVWQLIGMFFASGIFLIPLFYLFILNKFVETTEPMGMMAVVIGSLFMGFISFVIGSVIIGMTRFVFWWKHG